MKLEKVRKSWNSLQMVFLYQNSEREVAWDLEMNINIVNNFNISVWIEYEYLHTIKEPYILVGRSRWFWSETKNLKYPHGISIIHRKIQPGSPIVQKTPLFTVRKPSKWCSFWKRHKNIVREKCTVLRVSLPEIKGYFGQPVSAV